VGLDNPIHLAILLLVLLMVFGAKRLPEMGRSLGAGLRGFKQSINGEAAGPEELGASSATVADATIGEPEQAPIRTAA
jgi:sec-independent protein translocase protein TatA